MALDRDAIRDIAFIAAAWEESDDSVRAALAQDPEAALEGFMQAIEQDEGHWWSLYVHRDLFTIDQLEAAGAPGTVLDRMKLEQEARERGEDPAAVARRRPQRPPPEEVEEPPPTFAALLARSHEESDGMILANANYFASQVKDLDDDERGELRERLASWWPDKPFRQTITWESAKSWRIEYGAQAWLRFGPALDAELPPSRWAEIAVSGVLFEEEISWLRQQWTPEAAEGFAALCDDTDARLWHTAIKAMPDPLPDLVVDAAARTIEASEDGAYGVRYIGERMVAAERLDAIEQLAQRAALRPGLLSLLATAGDAAAQHELVDELLAALRVGERPDESRLRWLPEVTDEDLLPKLFECLPLVYGVGAQIKDTAQWFRSDVVNPLMLAIRTIGGRSAVEGYDKLIREHPDFQFLRLQRQGILQSMLLHDGLEAAEMALHDVSLPVFEAFPDS